MTLFRKRLTTRRSKKNDDFLESLRKELTAQWQEQSTRMLQEWMNQANQSLEQVLSDTLLSLTQPADQTTSSPFSGIPPFNPQGSGAGDGFSPFATASQTLGRLFSAIVSSRSHQRKTTIHSAETDRSKEANQAFRLSKSQQQAQLAEAASFGQRNR